MRDLKRAEFAVLSVTALCLAFTAGFFIGRGASGGDVTIEKLAAADRPSISASPSAGHAPEGIPEYAGSVEAAAPVPDAAAVSDAAAEPDASGDGEAAGLININTASAAELDALPGIGEVLAGRIIEYRETTGGFKSVEEIMAVSGIGEKKYGDIKDMITVG
jgi:competence protein ComEA